MSARRARATWPGPTTSGRWSSSALHFGRVDILDNNVGIVVLGGPVETDEATWDRVIAVNLKSLFLT